MAYREKVQWVSLLAMLGVWGVYFWRLGDAVAAGHPAVAVSITNFVGAVILLTVIQVAVTIAIALWRPSEAERAADPREREIERNAGNVAYHLLFVLVATVMLAVPALVMVVPAALPTPPAGTAVLLIGNALLAALVLAAIVHAVAQLVQFRRAG